LQAAADALDLPLRVLAPGAHAEQPGDVVVHSIHNLAPVVFGQADPRNARAVIEALHVGAQHCLDGTFDGLVTGPGAQGDDQRRRDCLLRHDRTARTAGRLRGGDDAREPEPCASRSPPRTCRCARCPMRSPAMASNARCAPCIARCAWTSASRIRASPCSA
jgi:hypothetical protein